MLLAVARGFVQAALAAWATGADGSCAQQIAGLQVAAGTGVVGNLLGEAPVQMLEIAAANNRRRACMAWLDGGLHVDVKISQALLIQVG